MGIACLDPLLIKWKGIATITDISDQSLWDSLKHTERFDVIYARRDK
jgi:hypothetical protein